MVFDFPVRLEDYSEHVRPVSLTPPCNPPENLWLSDPPFPPGGTFIPSQNHSVLELRNNFWISPTYTPANIYIGNAPLITITSPLNISDELPSLNHTLPYLTEPSTSCALQSSDILIDPLLNPSSPISPKRSEISEWEDTQVVDSAMQGTD